MSRTLLLTGIILAMVAGQPAGAGDNFTKRPMEFLPDPGSLSLPDPAQVLKTPVPYAPAERSHDGADAVGTEILLEARLNEQGEPVSQGVLWRVFSETPEQNGDLPLVATARGGTTSIQLEPGAYLVHAAFGLAGATKRINVGQDALLESLVLDAGGLKLSAIAGEDHAIPTDRLTFEISRDGEDSGPPLVVPNVKPDRVVRLQAGNYHVVSRYGQVNAVVRADIEVNAGKLTEIVFRHSGAQVTLKLVANEGGEAIANTSWAVLTKEGETLQESVGAFPQLVLAEGEYTAVARHDGHVYRRDFKIEPGLDRDVEVRLSDIVSYD
ncbi:hypothetical protein [Propylenella binzhouense]|uniref:Uncharacterized protein n=1 Tax=Propylenella binzhouense TaxID=2555902 RepID=A0A964T3J7_9HYPH|nr:hypothetical protein [Propylenella binzhouense]MYZ47846.1 hypothetical protein [Propylenella binzhouense]